MIRRTPAKLFAGLVAAALLATACGGDDTDDTSSGTEAPGTTDGGSTTPPTAGGGDTTLPGDTTPPSTEPAPSEGWAVDTELCLDPDAANAPIEGELKIGMVLPQSGGIAAAAFAPVGDGFQQYIDYAEANGLVTADVDLTLLLKDDQYQDSQTPGKVNELLDEGVQVFSGIIGSPNNLAVRDTLNDECIPQLNALTGSPQWGTDVADYPWTTGALVNYPDEVAIYGTQIKQLYPDGGTIGLFYVNNEFGKFYADAVKEQAGDWGFEVIEEQTVEAGDETAPVSQVSALAEAKPDVIMAVPLGLGCPPFLKEVEAKKAQDSSWTPALFLTTTCSSTTIMALSGTAAVGLYTSTNVTDVTDPANAENPGVAPYLAWMEEKGLSDKVSTAAAGWLVGEITVAIINQAAASPEGLTQASIINAARNFTIEPTLGRPGVVDTMNGEEDPFLAESLQIVQWNGTTYDDVGELVTDFEG